MKKKGRGMSYDEKKDKLLKIFHSTKTIFNYAEIQKLSVKAGIPFPVVKDLLKTLQADNLIESEKIGAGVFYWSFPSRAYQTYKFKIESTEKEIAALKEENGQLKTKIEENQAGRQETEERLEKIEEVQRMKSEKAHLSKEIEKYIRFDPERIDNLKKQIQEKKSQTNFWTDNLQQFKKYLKKTQPGIRDKDIEAQYEIPADLDYVE